MSWQPIRYRWQWQLKSSAGDLWPYVADTQRFNVATHLPSINFTEEPIEGGGSRRLAETSKLGISVRYEDYPFEWVQRQAFTNLRVFEHGPLARTLAHLTLVPNADGTLLKYDVDVTPANLLGYVGIPYQFGWEMRRNFERIFRQIDDALQNRTSQPFNLPSHRLRDAERTRLNDLTQSLIKQGFDTGWVEQLRLLLSTEAEMDLARIRPYPLADKWGIPRRGMLEMLLSATKIGMLNMRWDVICPLCQGAKSTASTLDEIQSGVHCNTCNIEFEGNFSDNVELTFIPHPQIREVNEMTYCIGGPMVTPHILVHQMLEPGEQRTMQMPHLDEDGYRIRTQRPGQELWLDRSQHDVERLDSVSITVSGDTINVDTEAAISSSDAPVTIEMHNDTDAVQRVFVERLTWYTDAVNAAQVTSLQHFRDLFTTEVLRPGEQFAIKGMTILFSDLVGSTAMYNQWGDAPSYAVVREQFSFLGRIVREHEGAIVKTIGDAIMAAFSQPANAVAAAIAIQRELADFNAKQTTPLTIRLGAHYGPCIAVNLNGRLDYFGTTVNLAARLEGQSRGNDVVISGVLRHDPAIKRLLEDGAINVAPFETAIKGFDDDFELYRLTINESHSARQDVNVASVVV